MYLTPEQQAILDGSKGEVMAKVMKTLVMYGDTKARFQMWWIFRIRLSRCTR